MKVKALGSIVALGMAASLACGCANEPAPKGKPKGNTPAAATGTAKPAAAGDTKPAKSAEAGKKGKGVIKGAVSFTGTAPEMKVPPARLKNADCKGEELPLNAVIVKDGKLKDVLVRIAPGQLDGYEASGDISIDQKGCMYSPRIMGALPSQKVKISNSDAFLHNVNAGLGTETLFNSPQAKGADPIVKSDFEDPGIYRLKCDVHSWMRAFVVVNDNPFYAVSGDDGTFTIKGVPDGKYKLEAWHSQYGSKTTDVDVKGGAVTADFSYDGTEPEPAENQGELKAMEG